MRNDTKENILESALTVFARDGYAGTNIKDIVESVGLVKSAFYRHYKSKEEIWNAVLQMMISYYEEHFGSVEHLPLMSKNTNELYEMTMKMIDFTIHDENFIKMRKIILTEQFRDDRIRNFATRYFIDDTKALFEKVFSEMMKAGTIKNCNAEFLSFSYTAPITALIHLCDREPEHITDTVAEIEIFVKEFIKAYCQAK